jgi:hypothetical protein
VRDALDFAVVDELVQPVCRVLERRWDDFGQDHRGCRGATLGRRWVRRKEGMMKRQDGPAVAQRHGLSINLKSSSGWRELRRARTRRQAPDGLPASSSLSVLHGALSVEGAQGREWWWLAGEVRRSYSRVTLARLPLAAVILGITVLGQE